MKHVFFLVNGLALLMAVGSNLLVFFAWLRMRQVWVKHLLWAFFALSIIVLSQTFSSYLLVNSVDNYVIKSMMRLIGVTGCTMTILFLPRLGHSFFGRSIPKKTGSFFTLLAIAQSCLYILYELNVLQYLSTIIVGAGLLTVFVYLIRTITVQRQHSEKWQKSVIKRFTLLLSISAPFMVLDIYIEKIPVIGAYFPYGILSVPLFFIALNSLIIIYGFRFLQAFISSNHEQTKTSSSDSLNPEEFYDKFEITPREKEVILLLIRGNTYQQICDALHISMPTTKRHVYNIYQKTGLKNRMELANQLKGLL